MTEPTGKLGQRTWNHGWGLVGVTFDPPSAGPPPLTSADCMCEPYDGPERCPEHGIGPRLSRRFNYVHNGREVPR